MVLRDIVYKSENLIIQQMQRGNKIAVIVGSGHSLSVDDSNNVVFRDIGWKPPKDIKDYGDECTIFSIYFPKSCSGLAVAGKELATYVNTQFQDYEKVIFHGHSKCGCCFVNLAKWLRLRPKVTIVSVSAPLKGTPMADIETFSKGLNAFEKFFYYKIFSNHKVDQDIAPNSDFIKTIDLHSFTKFDYHIIVSKCALTPYPTDWILWLVDILGRIHGDGVVPLKSQIIEDLPYFPLQASHISSMKQSCAIVRVLINL